MLQLSSFWRRILLVSLALVAMLLLIAAAFGFRTQRHSAQVQVAAAESELAGAIGINLDASELADPRLSETLTRLDTSGVRWARFFVSWDQVEPARGEYDWHRFDQVFGLLREHPRLQPLVVLNGAPAWARRAGDADNPLAPPLERADFGAFAAAVAKRYGSQTRYYQVWQEPNIAPHWGARPVDPSDYAGLVREAAMQIHATDPDATIVLAALAPNTEAGGANLSDIDFLEMLYRAGAGPWFDAVAAQPYGFSAAPDASAGRGSLNFARTTLLRDVMDRNGDGGKRVWAVSFGWNALPQDWAGRPSPWGQVDEQEQAEYAAQAVDLVITRWPWLGPMFWPAYCPSRPADDAWLGFALCAQDGSARPIAAALARAASRELALAAGNHAADHPAIRYGPGWRVTASAADPSADGDALTSDFVGTGSALKIQGGPYWAYYTVTVDGQPSRLLPRDESGASYLVLYDPAGEQRLVPVASDLAPRLHQVRLEAHGGWGQWALQGIRVEDRPAATWLPPWWSCALGALVLAMAWLWIARRSLVQPARWVLALVEHMASWPDSIWWGLAAALGLALALSPALPLDLLVLAGLGVVFFIRPDASLPVIAFSIPLWPKPKSFAGWEFSLYEILLWLVAAAAVARWLLSGLATRDIQAEPGGAPGRSEDSVYGSGIPASGVSGAQRPRRHGVLGRVLGALSSLDWSVLALLAVGLAATLAANRSDVAMREFRTVFVTGALFYGVITRAPWPRGRGFSWRPVVIGLLLGMALVSLVALWQLISGQGRIDVEGVGRVRAFYGSPNNLALVLDRAVPLALALAAFGSLGGKRIVQRVLLAAMTILLLLACIVTFSKGALLLGLPVGLAAVLLVGARRSRSRWPLWVLVGLALIGLLGFAALSSTPRFADLTNLRSGTGFFRVKLWQSAWRMALEHPWLGVGPDNFLYAYRSRYVLPSAWQELNLSHPHNLVLDLATRLGVLGLLAAFWGIFAGLARCWRLVHNRDAAVWPLALGLLGGIAATLAHGLIDNSLFLIDLMALFMLAQGIIQRLYYGNKEVLCASW